MPSLIKCDNCGAIDYALVDGYHFGDRMLEGVMFKVFQDENCFRVESEKDWDSTGYLRQLNKEYWLSAALENAPKEDILECPHCHDDVVMPNFMSNFE